ncbi:MAG: DUF2147 domain-containing protein [Pseudobdellovibrionaceae bacterium]
MKQKLPTFLLTCLTLTVGAFSSSAFAQTTPDAEGYWLTENQRAVVKTEHCNGNQLCGKIHWIIEGGMQTDSKNPDEALRNRPMCGLEILNGFTQNRNNPKGWEGGHIYKADDGDIYNATVTIKDDSHLWLRGYVGLPIFGKSQTWTRVNPDDYKQCK